jgi:uncharacterized zinc-type alcohol dehydrogenase-like protein
LPNLFFLQARFANLAESVLTFTYNSPDKHLEGKQYEVIQPPVVVDEKFVLRIR